MQSLTHAIEQKISQFTPTYLPQDLLTLKAIKNIAINEQKIVITIVFGFACEHFRESLTADLPQLLAEFSKQVEIDLSWKIEPHVGQKNLKSLPQIKNIIAIASGKGGVGKSTVAVNFALSLAKAGAAVGILDADIYGPSIPVMLGAKTKPVIEEKKIFPVLCHGIQSMSIGYLVAASAAMVWRGPMISMALQQLFNDTQWQNLDYLIVDLPPGTGDIQLTLAQKIPVSAAVVVTTPQDLALADVRRACEMFRKVNVPVLGVVENMSMHICSACGHEDAIFGVGGGSHVAAEFAIELLGQLPLDRRIREETDSGLPPVIGQPNSEYAKKYMQIASLVAAKLALQPKDYSGKFPPVVVTT